MSPEMISTASPMSGSIDALIEQISRLPKKWHLAGSVGLPVLRAMARYMEGRDITHSAETGSGKTTLLLSHLSRQHTVFALEDDNRSITVVRESPLLKADSVDFVEGPTQVTLPRFDFKEELQFALIDGPHAYPFPDMEYYFLYPHLATGGLLLVDDVHISTINHLFKFLKEEPMFNFLSLVDKTAFFQRTDAPLFDPQGDGWWLQKYNTRRFPVESIGEKVTKYWSRNGRRARRALRRLAGRT